MTDHRHGLVTRQWNRPLLASCAVTGGIIAVAVGLLTVLDQGQVIPLSSPVTESHTGTAAVQLREQPPGTTGLEMELICLTAGSFEFPGGATSICSEADAASPTSSRSSLLMGIEQGQDSVTIKTGPQSRWRLSAKYVKQERKTMMIWDAVGP
jgi:hypothetical protein